ncbi:DsbA family protein [Halanaeroarchaeum sulfurireducens]|uniref:DSBA oxidoreductase n=1 Tax=Halanaeroarchaeum sulfurireducens TaxID=1604004 RepID=A0A0F7PEK7_9EURY|nr:thioredoxin domain-containing protein [Halanaeroarchaeum sulfurireducens]AKH97748.1 DSBA oxidoreductase [Halanaeroarchaeum sulfurireducens]ALG82143.1 DSBA oxidoreductase [Halanaeroarchaeum sulfurireducens]
MTNTRRSLLRTGGSLLVVGTAGCLGSGGDPETTTAESTTDEPFELPATVTADSLASPTIGPSDAPVTVSVYADFACKHCRNFVLDVFPDLRDEYVSEGVVRYEYHDYPIPVDEQWSWQMASAARAVQDQLGAEAYFAFTSGIFDHHGSYSMDVVDAVAEEVGADPDVVEQAANEETYRPVVEAEKAAGLEAGVEYTPTIFVDGTNTEQYKGADEFPYEWRVVSEAIEAARD